MEIKQFMESLVQYQNGEYSAIISFPRFPRNDGKGKYQITVPEPFKFDKRDKGKGKSIREQKLEEDLKWKRMVEDYEIAQQFNAKEIPKSTLEPRF